MWCVLFHSDFNRPRNGIWKTSKLNSFIMSIICGLSMVAATILDYIASNEQMTKK